MTSDNNLSLPCLAQVEEFCNIKFDFLIIGGGTAGLTLANRLSENANWKVGVLEAGRYIPNDLTIRTPASWAQLLGNADLTWQMSTVPQKNLNDKSIVIPTGKVLGGSSIINLLMFQRAGKHDYDAWGAIGNPGWNWEGLLPYFKKTEKYHPQGLSILNPKKSFEEHTSHSIGIEELSKYHGFDGNIEVSYETIFTELESKTAEAFLSLGIRFNNHQGSANATGFCTSGRSISPATQERCSSVDGYLTNISSRPNLFILNEAMVTRILFDDNSKSGLNLKATGAEFLHQNKRCIATACKEVIVSGGTLKTPQILELSGIGDRSRLTAYGIPTLLHLPTVGENLIDHHAVFVRIKLKDTSMGFKLGEIPRPISHTCFSSLHDMCTSETVARLKAFLEEELSARQLTPLQNAQYKILKKFIDQQDVSLAEFIVVGPGVSPMADAHAITLVLQHPFSRGSVHIRSNDPLINSDVDPNYFDNSYDLEIMKEMMKFVDRVFKSDALSECLLDYIQPENVDFVKSFKDEDYRDYLATYSHTCFHPVGTAAMAPRELGGVVSPSLKVYGTDNLRVVDASIFPLQIAAHTQATVYAIAEKTADIIKAEDWNI